MSLNPPKCLSNYIERMDYFFEVSKTGDDRKAALPLSVISPEPYGTLWNSMQPHIPKDNSYSELVETLKGHYMLKICLHRKVSIPTIVTIRWIRNRGICCRAGTNGEVGHKSKIKRTVLPKTVTLK